jgi:hypothetical protein
VLSGHIPHHSREVNPVDVFVLLECSTALIGSWFFNISGKLIGTIFKGEAFVEELWTDSLSRKFGK